MGDIFTLTTEVQELEQQLKKEKERGIMLRQKLNLVRMELNGQITRMFLVDQEDKEKLGTRSPITSPVGGRKLPPIPQGKEPRKKKSEN